MTAWVFVILLNLPSFGGEVTATIHAGTLEACEKLRKVVAQQFGGEANIRGSITNCIAVSKPALEGQK